MTRILAAVGAVSLALLAFVAWLFYGLAKGTT